MIPVRKVRELTLERVEGDEHSSHVSAASSLVREKETLFVIADDERQLALFPTGGGSHGRMIDILEVAAPASSDKPDLEALTFLPPWRGHPHGALLAIASGSKKTRTHGALVPLDERGLPSDGHGSVDLSDLYSGLSSRVEKLNLEGAAVIGDVLCLMQRGNAEGATNAVVQLDLDKVSADLGEGRIAATSIVSIDPYDLGHLHGVKLSFSDASPLEDGRMAFAASAEAPSKGQDGATVGSSIGVMELSGDVTMLEPIDADIKIEGLTARLEQGRMELLMVTDADDPSVPSPLLAAEIPEAG